MLGGKQSCSYLGLTCEVVGIPPAPGEEGRSHDSTQVTFKCSAHQRRRG